VRSSSSSRATIVLLRYLRRIDPAVLRRCVSLRESSDVVDTRTSFRLSTVSSNRDMGLKISTASTSVQLRRMVKSWGTAGARSRSDTLPKRHILARARGGGYTAVVQAIVAQLAVYATKTASDVLSTVMGALASVLTKRQVRATLRQRSSSRTSRTSRMRTMRRRNSVRISGVY
jgi:hypothetical protein